MAFCTSIMTAAAPGDSATQSAAVTERSGPPRTATPTINTTNNFNDTSIVPSDVPQGPGDRAEQGKSESLEDIGINSRQPSPLRVVGSLVLVIALILGVVYVMKIIMAKGMRYDLKGKHIRVVDVLNLGVNRTLYLVEVGGRKLLLSNSGDKGLAFVCEVAATEGEWTPDGGISFEDEKGKEYFTTDESEPSKPVMGMGTGFVDQLKEKIRELDDEKRNEG